MKQKSLKIGFLSAGCQFPQTIIVEEGLRHHPEDQSGITRKGAKKHEWNFFPLIYL